jgi:putative PIN family toxin of toxin-antitoxin system
VKQRAVVDPNILVSAFVSPHGFPARIVRVSDRNDAPFEMIISVRLVEELRRVLMRERFRRYGTVERAEAHVRRVMRSGIFATEQEIEPVSEDPKDDYLIALYRSSNADFLVSGDPHLLDLEGEDRPHVVTPRQFWEAMEREAAVGGDDQDGEGDGA